MIIEGQFQVFQRFSSSKLVLKTVESCFSALNYYENGSTDAAAAAADGMVSSEFEGREATLRHVAQPQ
jgi:hypothetical protein